MGDQHQQTGTQWLEKLLSLQGLSTQVSAESVEDNEGSSCWLTIDNAPLEPDQVSGLLGEKGRVLDAMQYLANTTLNLGRASEEQQAYTLELAGHRAKRYAELEAMAAEAAKQVEETEEAYEIAGLSSAERRQMHQLMKAYEGLETFSQGREPERHLMVRKLS
ncbi:MAG: protein jag [Leptolyngbyaceae cyanobacterium]